mmetsp:Transcript_30200/g.44930  ORF Transcript_30200/g.44930 Transcript_30200/m.44930 type:complete len:114 (+) Transcript_30200:1835-2176(+)
MYVHNITYSKPASTKNKSKSSFFACICDVHNLPSPLRGIVCNYPSAMGTSPSKQTKASSSSQQTKVAPPNKVITEVNGNRNAQVTTRLPCLSKVGYGFSLNNKKKQQQRRKRG